MLFNAARKSKKMNRLAFLSYEKLFYFSVGDESVLVKVVSLSQMLGFRSAVISSGISVIG